MPPMKSVESWDRVIIPLIPRAQSVAVLQRASLLCLYLWDSGGVHCSICCSLSLKKSRTTFMSVSNNTRKSSYVCHQLLFDKKRKSPRWSEKLPDLMRQVGNIGRKPNPESRGCSDANKPNNHTIFFVVVCLVFF